MHYNTNYRKWLLCIEGADKHHLLVCHTETILEWCLMAIA